MTGHFFAMLSRMKYINRWALMRNSREENICEHSLEVAMISHALATLGNVRFGKELDADRAAVIGIFHDSPEIITGDMPTPIKYYNAETQEAFKKVEDEAADSLLALLPEDMREVYRPLFFKQQDEEYLWKLVKAADRISALIKCIEEGKAGNTEFKSAADGIMARIKEMGLPEAEAFLTDFLPSYKLTLDELRK